MLIELPNGLLDGPDLFNFAEVDELRGKQQNYLINRELVVNNVGHVPKILEDLVKALQTKEGLSWRGDIKDAIQKLPAGDLETILIRIRQNTFGERFYHQAQCPHCNNTDKDLRLDLDKLELTKMSLEELMDKAKRTIKLKKCGLEVELKPYYLRDLFDAIKIATGNHDALVTGTLALSIKRIGENSKVTPKDLEDIPSADIAQLNEFAETVKLEGSIDTEIINECSACKKEFSSKLNCYDPTFFSPTKGFKSTTI
jgi:hypothetical protein